MVFCCIKNKFTLCSLQLPPAFSRVHPFPLFLTDVFSCYSTSYETGAADICTHPLRKDVLHLYITTAKSSFGKYVCAVKASSWDVWMYHILSGLRRMTAGALSHWAVWSSGVCCFVARLHFRLTWLQLQTEQLNWSKWKPGFCFIYKEARQHSTYGVNVGKCFYKFKNINGTKVLLRKCWKVSC